MTLTPFGYFDLIEKFSQSGCVVCNLLTRDVGRVLDSLLNEHVVEPEIHEKLRASRGLCNEHGWQLAQMGNVMGVGILYQAVLHEVLKSLRKASPDGNSQTRIARRLFSQSGNNAALVDALEAKAPCLVCEMENDYESRYVSVLADQLKVEKMQSAFRQSEGLCLEHFKQTLDYARDKESSQLLIDIQRDIWESLYVEVSDFVRKYEFKYAKEKMGAEGDSWLRTLARMSGEKGMFGMRRK